MKIKGEEISPELWLAILSLVLVLLGASILTYYYTINEINSCTANPINYTAEKYSQSNISYDYAVVYFYFNKEDTVANEKIEINLKEKK